MNKQQEALKLALEAMQECRRDPRLKYEHPYYDKTITAIREALAEQPARQEPVGEIYRYGRDSHGREWHGIHWYDANVDVLTGTRIYTSPPASKPWVGLTDEEMKACTQSPFVVENYRAIEAKLREKNT